MKTMKKMIIASVSVTFCFSLLVGCTHNIDRLAVKEELMLLKESYLPEYMKRQTDEHARRMVRIIFDPLLDCL